MAVALTSRQRLAGKPEAEKRRIIENAAKLFLSRGYDATTMDDIASAMHATKGYIYYYFRSKPEVFTDLYVMAMDDLRAHLLQSIPHGKDPLTKLRTLVTAHVAFMVRNSPVRVVATHRRWLVDREDFPPRYRRRIYEKLDSIYRVYYPVMAGGMAAGALQEGDPKELAQLVAGAVVSLVSWYRPGVMDISTGEVAARISRMIEAPPRSGGGAVIRLPRREEA